MEREKSLGEIKNLRDKEIIKVSGINIIVNIILSIFKGVVGYISNSIAIQADAINSLSDAMAAIVTIIGIKLSGKEPNKKHPLGYGRYEYLSDGIVSFLVIYAGINVFTDSINKIIKPEAVDYSYTTILVLVVAVVLKIFLGIHEKKVGKEHNSKALQASGVDSISDAFVTSAVVLSIFIYVFLGINLEAYLGVFISILIVKSGIVMFKDTIDEILGKRVKGDLIKNIKETITEEENVYGAFDLILHSYGPDKYIGSIHIEVPSNLSINELDFMERKITKKIFYQYGVYLSGIGIYSVDVENQEIISLRKNISDICMSYVGVLQLHGFVADLENKNVRFDLIIDFSVEDSKSLIENIRKDIERMYPEYSIYIQKDLDIDL